VPNLESNQVFIWGTANVFPVLSMLAVPFLRWQPAGTGRRVLVGVWAVASVVAIPLSAGRAGWLGIVAALVVYDWLSGSSWARRLRGWLSARRLMAIVSGVGLLAVLAVAVFVVTHFTEVLDSALDGRGPIWQQAVAIFASDPLTGGGPSTYSWLRLEHVPAFTDPIPVRLAHSVPLLTLADGGLILAGACVGLLVVFARSVRPFVGDPQRRTAVATLIGFVAASCFDDFSSLPAVIAIVVTLAGWTVASTVPAPARVQSLNSSVEWWRNPLGPTLILPVALVVIGVVAIIPVIGVDRARVAAASAREAAVSGDWKTAATQFSTATDAYGTDAGYWLGLGLASAHLGSPETAELAYERARALSPGDPRGWGAVATLSHSPSERVSLFQRAAEGSINDPAYAFLLGRALESSGSATAAIHAYAIAVAIDRQLINALAGDQRRAVEAEVGPVMTGTLSSPSLSVTAARWDLALADRDIPSDMAPAWRALALAQRGASSDARAAASLAQAAAPYDATTLRGLQAVARLTCDAPRYAAITELIGESRSPRGSLRVVRDHTYREDMLSSYLPPAPDDLPDADALPPARAWPWGLIGDPPACPDWPDAP
jgi:tetratricopeptide (TPR) repeat protein